MNEFYRLDGAKFSTSRRHAIWGPELLAEVLADVVRSCLAATCPEVEQTSFSLPEFAEAIDRELLGEWQGWLAELARLTREGFGGRVPATGDWTEHRRFFSRLETLSAKAAEAYETRTFSPQRAARILAELVREARHSAKAEESWRRVAARSEKRRTAAALELLAAKLLAVLSFPLLPGSPSSSGATWASRPRSPSSAGRIGPPGSHAAGRSASSAQEALEKRRRLMAA